MFNIGNFTCEDNPGGHAFPVAGATTMITMRPPRPRDTWTLVRRVANAARNLAAAAPRCAGDRLFARTDAEANWHGWQILRECGGMTRRYRDPAFNLLSGCTSCLGSGTDTGLPCLACLTCNGSGRESAAGGVS